MHSLQIIFSLCPFLPLKTSLFLQLLSIARWGCYCLFHELENKATVIFKFAQLNFGYLTEGTARNEAKVRGRGRSTKSYDPDKEVWTWFCRWWGVCFLTYAKRASPSEGCHPYRRHSKFPFCYEIFGTPAEPGQWSWLRDWAGTPTHMCRAPDFISLPKRKSAWTSLYLFLQPNWRAAASKKCVFYILNSLILESLTPNGKWM